MQPRSVGRGHEHPNLPMWETEEKRGCRRPGGAGGTDREDSRDGERPPGMRTPEPPVSGMTLPHHLKEASCHDTRHFLSRKWAVCLLGNPSGRRKGERAVLAPNVGSYYAETMNRASAKGRLQTPPRPQQSRSDENKHVQGVLTGRSDTLNAVTCGDSQYTVLIHVQVFTTRLKRGPCVPSRLAD